MMYPKPSWSEQTAHHHTRLCYSFDEALLLRYHADRATEPSPMAYARFVGREVGRDP